MAEAIDTTMGGTTMGCGDACTMDSGAGLEIHTVLVVNPQDPRTDEGNLPETVGPDDIYSSLYHIVANMTDADRAQFDHKADVIISYDNRMTYYRMTDAQFVEIYNRIHTEVDMSDDQAIIEWWQKETTEFESSMELTDLTESD